MDAAVVTGVLGIASAVVTGVLALMSTRFSERARIREKERSEVITALRAVIDEQQEYIQLLRKGLKPDDPS